MLPLRDTLLQRSMLLQKSMAKQPVTVAKRRPAGMQPIRPNLLLKPLRPLFTTDGIVPILKSACGLSLFAPDRPGWYRKAAARRPETAYGPNTSR